MAVAAIATHMLYEVRGMSRARALRIIWNFLRRGHGDLKSRSVMRHFPKIVWTPPETRPGDEVSEAL